MEQWVNDERFHFSVNCHFKLWESLRRAKEWAVSNNNRRLENLHYHDE